MILRDPVHGLVAFETPEQQIVPALLHSREVQRLRQIRQLGLASLAYPGADHTRFSHSLGTCHVMARFLDRCRAVHEALPYWQRVTTERARDALAAALLHDLGHGPFSHLFESALPGGLHHEQWTLHMVLDDSTDVNRILRQQDPGLPERVAALIEGKHSLPYLSRAVSGTFDVDRCDYLLRDAHFTGVNYGRYDLEWLLRSFLIVETEEGPQLAIDGVKSLPAIESFVLARLFMFQQVYFHKASRASEWMLGRVLGRAHTLLQDGTHLPACPTVLKRVARGEQPTLGEYLELDDVTLGAAFRAWEDGGDPILQDLCCRLRHRQLFKTTDLYDLGPKEEEALLAKAQAIADTRGLPGEHYVGLDHAEDSPYGEGKGHLAVVSPHGKVLRPSEISLVLGRLEGQTLRRSRLVYAHELRPAIEELCS